MVEDKQTLLFLCETLKAHTTYITGLHHNVVSLYEALLRKDPELRESYREEMEQIRLFPKSERLDALIHELKR